MTLTDLQVFVSALVNDPNNTRYATTDINTELDNSQDEWNLEAKIIKDTVTLTVVSGQYQYAISGLTGTPISFVRATHKGLPLKKRSKSYFDLFASGQDWTTTQGTPTDYFVDIQISANQYVSVHPVPQGADAGANLVVEYIKRHTAMSAVTDTPFMSGTNANSLLRPFDYGLGYSVAAKLLARDPTPETVQKVSNYNTIANRVKANVVQVFEALEKEEPLRLRSTRLGVRRRSLRTV
jgi:hypothetical protein